MNQLFLCIIENWGYKSKLECIMRIETICKLFVGKRNFSFGSIRNPFINLFKWTLFQYNKFRSNNFNISFYYVWYYSEEIKDTEWTIIMIYWTVLLFSSYSFCFTISFYIIYITWTWRPKKNQLNNSSGKGRIFDIITWGKCGANRLKHHLIFL